MKEYRCKFCHKLLFKASTFSGTLNIICPKCKTYNGFEINVKYFVDKTKWHFGSGSLNRKP